MREDGETIEQAALRELHEEAGVLAIDYEKVAEMTYHFPATPDWNQVVHVYLVTRWGGEPKETAEMTAEWFPFANIPYDRMWDNDKYWLPQVLLGKKVKGSVIHDGNKTIEKNIELVETFETG